MQFLRWLWAVLTFQAWRHARNAKMRRERYEELKELISLRHFGGFAGLIVNDPKYDVRDMQSFTVPMYQVVKNQDHKFCIFWDRARMAREIGTGAPLKDGEVLLPDTLGRTKPSSTLDTVDEQKPLTQKATDGAGEVV